MFTIFAFYCDSAEKAEDIRAQRPVNIVFALLAVAYIALAVYLIKRGSRFQKWQRVLLYILVPLLAVTGIAAFFFVSLMVSPNWCNS